MSPSRRPRLPASPPGAPLPVDEVFVSLREALRGGGQAVLEAPPGAGKTTRVPLALLELLGDGRLVVLEPRRVAARAAAARMASMLGERLGDTVGLSTRDERHVSRRTRIEVVTEGVLLRRLQRDPSLAGTDLVMFDEFHERNLVADLALAFVQDTRLALREDLSVLVASATIDGARIAELLGGAPVLTAHGRRFEVAVHHRDRPTPGTLAQTVRDEVRELMAVAPGDVLVFLPGAGEIRRTARLLEEAGDPSLLIRPLFGALPPAAQDAALAPAPAGHRKVVLATDLAESSLTVEGVRLVVDAGLAREPRFDPTTGLSGLVTVPASRAAADQRAGRAGRTAPGVCVRLWPAREHAARDAAPRAAIVTDDLSATALEVAMWGAEVTELALLDQPPEDAWAHAHETLRELGAIDDRGRPTPHGRELGSLPLHPRLAHLLLIARDRGRPGLGAELAALLTDRDVLAPDRDAPDADLATRLLALRGHRVSPQLRRGALQRARRERDRLLAAIGAGAHGEDAEVDEAGALVLAAWPDQLAARRSGQPGRFLLAQGRGAVLGDHDPLARTELLAVAHVDRGQGEATIRLATAVDERDVREMLAHRITRQQDVAWQDGDVEALDREQLGAIVLSRRPLGAPPADQVLAALLDGLRETGLELLDVRAADRGLQARAAFVARHRPDWPGVDDTTLLEHAEDAIAGFLTTARRRSDLAAIRFRDVLVARLGPQRLRALDRLAPTGLTVPSGRRRSLRYPADGPPVLAVKLQELFGARETPRVLDGTVPVLLHLLSPAERPVQVTEDLAGFWERGYAEVRAELRGRYPKHAWPEDPLTATPVAGVRRR